MIADMIDQAVAAGCTAHEAETRAIEQIRQLGQEVLKDWAQKAEPEFRQQAQASNPKLIDYGKKTPDLAHQLRSGLRSGTVFACGPSRSAGTPVLPTGADHAARLL